MALLDYLIGRRAEIEAQMKSLKGELAEIRVAEAALTGAPTGRSVVASAAGPTVVREGSIKDWVLKALMLAPFGLDTERIIDGVQRIGGPEVPRNSMTPQLSRLKSAGLIDQEGRIWRLVSQSPPQNDEAPGGETPDAPEDEDHLDLG